MLPCFLSLLFLKLKGALKGSLSLVIKVKAIGAVICLPLLSRENFKTTSTWALSAGEDGKEKGEGLMLSRITPTFNKTSSYNRIFVADVTYFTYVCCFSLFFVQLQIFFT